MKQWKVWLVSIVAGMVSIALCCGIAASIFGFISFPSTETLARRYLNAVLDENEEAAAALAGSEAVCQRQVREDARIDIVQFRRAEVRNVTIVTRYNTGSDDEIQFAMVEFEYRKPPQTEWQHGEMRLITDHPVPGFRYICGNLKHHGP